MVKHVAPALLPSRNGRDCAGSALKSGDHLVRVLQPRRDAIDAADDNRPTTKCPSTNMPVSCCRSARCNICSADPSALVELGLCDVSSWPGCGALETIAAAQLALERLEGDRIGLFEKRE